MLDQSKGQSCPLDLILAAYEVADWPKDRSKSQRGLR